MHLHQSVYAFIMLCNYVQGNFRLLPLMFLSVGPLYSEQRLELLRIDVQLQFCAEQSKAADKASFGVVRCQCAGRGKPQYRRT